jgi:hypothetical protein
MQTMRNGFDGLSLLMMLNWDRLVFLFTITLALLAGAWFGSP